MLLNACGKYYVQINEGGCLKYNLGKVMDRIENYHIFNEQDTFQIKVTPIKECTRQESLRLAKLFKELSERE